MVTIATFNEPAKAKRLKDRLQQAGLKADIYNEKHLQALAFMSKPQANVKVNVDEEDFATAQQLLVEWETTDPDIGSAIHCPQCGSCRIEYPQLTRKFITPAVASILFALKVFQKEFYCQDCHFTWSDEEDQPRYRIWYRFFPRPEKEG
jgi:transposase-like protein